MKINKVVSLTKIFLKSSFQSFNEKNTGNKKSSGMYLLYGFLFIYLVGLVGFFSYNIINGLITIHQETMFLGLFLLLIAGLLVFQTIFSSMNVFYFSKDIEYILPLPLKPKEILMAKFNTILVTEYIMELIIGIVPLVIYGIMTGASFIYYISALLVLVIFPILPLLISTFLVMVIMSFAKFTKKRDAFQLIATIIIIAVVFVFQIFINKNSQMSQEQMIEQLTKSNGAVETISKYFITLTPSINAMNTNNIFIAVFELLKLIGITAVAYLIFIAVGQKLYFKGAIGNLVGGKSKTKKINIDKAYKATNIRVSYIKKEFKILIRNPIFFMQCILPSILMPVIFIFFGVLMSGSDESGNITELVSQIQNVHSTVIICVILGILQFLSMLTYISVTAISRDGQNAVFTKYIPVSLYKQFKYKAAPNIIMSIITSLIVIGCFYYLFPSVSIIFLIAIFLIALILNIIQSYLMLIVDLKRPKLEWTTEYAVVKQNMNMIFTMGLGLIGIIVMLIFGVVLGNVDIKITFSIMFIVFGIIAYLIDRYVNKNQVKLFKKII